MWVRANLNHESPETMRRYLGEVLVRQCALVDYLWLGVDVACSEHQLHLALKHIVTSGDQE